MLKSIEILNSIRAMQNEVENLQKEGKTDEALAKLNEIDNLRREYEEVKENEEEEKEQLKSMTNRSTDKFLNKQNITKKYANTENLSLGKYIKGAFTGNWENAEKEMNRFKALSTSTGTVLIPKELSADIIQLIMNKSLIYGSGVPVTDMKSGNMTIGKITKNPEFKFKEELAEAEKSEATFEGVDLKAKTVYGLMQVSLELLESASNLDAILKVAIAESLANAIDKALLYGTGGKEIKGIFNYDTVNHIEGSTITNYTNFINAIGKVRNNNGEPTVMGVNADIDTKLNLLVDANGQPLMPPKVIENIERVVSNNLKTDTVNGADSLVYDPMSMLIGQQVQINIETSRDKGFNDGSQWFRVYSMLDMAVLRPEHITKITGLK